CEKGIGCAITESRDQTGVVGSAMVVDVIGAEGLPREALKEIVLFVGSAIRSDETNGIGTVEIADALELRCNGLCGFFPGGGIELVAFAHHRLLDSLGMMGEVEAEAAFDAEEVLVDAGEVTIVGAQDLVIAHAEGSLAAVRTMRADRRHVL